MPRGGSLRRNPVEKIEEVATWRPEVADVGNDKAAMFFQFTQMCAVGKRAWDF
jgi:hypothetical protein